MKTPMQELYEKMFNEMQPNHPVGYNVVFGIAADMVKDMLEKEKEAMCEFALNSFFEITNNITKMDADGVHSKLALSIIKQKYEETFNTKEK